MTVDRMRSTCESTGQTATAAGAGRARALLAGATGLIGRELLALLLQDERYAKVHVLLRRARARPATRPQARPARRSISRALPALPAVDDVYVALGTTIKVAGSQAAFRAVDFDAVVATARAAREAGARRLAVVSALGADANSSVFYNRVKGEMQDAVAAARLRVGAVRATVAARRRPRSARPARARRAKSGRRACCAR